LLTISFDSGNIFILDKSIALPIFIDTENFAGKHFVGQNNRGWIIGSPLAQLVEISFGIRGVIKLDAFGFAGISNSNQHLIHNSSVNKTSLTAPINSNYGHKSGSKSGSIKKQSLSLKPIQSKLELLDRSFDHLSA
jgi:hypothetical protein